MKKISEKNITLCVLFIVAKIIYFVPYEYNLLESLLIESLYIDNVDR